MNQYSLPLQQLCYTAIDAARTAGRYIQSVDRANIQREYKDAGSSAASQLVTEVDLHSEILISDALSASCAQWGVAFVGEEASLAARGAEPARHTAPYFWCVDPLDGTLPFMEGKPGYAVSIALVDQSGVPLIGVVYDPVNNTLLHAIKGQGAFRNGSSIPPVSEASGQLLVFADASFKTQDNHDGVVDALNRCAQRLGMDGIDVVFGNGAVKNACQVLECATGCYIKLPKSESGGGSIWDFAATACIVQEADGWAGNIYGGALDLNRRDSMFMNHQGVVFASGRHLAKLLIDEFSQQLGRSM